MRIHHLCLCLALTGCAIDDDSDLEVDVDTVTQEATSASYQTCASTAIHGTRVCLDWTTGYGPVIQIYTGPNTVYASFGIDASRVPPDWKTSWVSLPYEWRYRSATWTEARMPSGFWLSTVSGAPQTLNQVGVDPQNHDLLEWFSNYPDFEFVTAY